MVKVYLNLYFPGVKPFFSNFSAYYKYPGKSAQVLAFSPDLNMPELLDYNNLIILAF